MYPDDALGVIGNQGQSILHGMETRLSTIGQLILHIKMILFAEPAPIVLLCLGQYKDNLQIRIVGPEPLECPHQHGLPSDWQELLGNVTPHPQALSACYNDNVIHQRAIRCLKRIPSAIWSEVCWSTN